MCMRDNSGTGVSFYFKKLIGIREAKALPRAETGMAKVSSAPTQPPQKISPIQKLNKYTGTITILSSEH